MRWMPRAARPAILSGAAMAALALAAALLTGPSPAADEAPAAGGPTVAPAVACRDPKASDQDDMCIWVHPTRSELSTVIASDKAAGRLIVYDLAGRTLQTVEVDRPGNIDVRYGIPLGGRKADVVAFNQRTRDYRICAYAVDAATRRIRRVDNGNIITGTNYGGCLYRSPTSGKLYFFTTSPAAIEQYELADDGTGKLAGRQVRSWKIGLSEGAVADDEAAAVYLAEEDRGVWRVGAEPNDPTAGRLVAHVGQHGLKADVEGLAIYHMPAGEGYLLVSSQGSDCFKVYRRGGDHEYVATFSIRGARQTDGIEVVSSALGPAFPKGLFACHTDSGGRPVLLTGWQEIAAAARPPLRIDNSWNPRR